MEVITLPETLSFVKLPTVAVLVKPRTLWGSQHITCTGTQQMLVKFWWGNFLENALGKPRRNCEDNIKVNVAECVVTVGDG